MSLLILCREETSDVTGLAQEMTRRGTEVAVATPQDVIVFCGGEGRVEFTVGGRPLRPRCVFGWVSLHQREHGLWLLKAFELAGVPVVNGYDVLDVGQNKFLNSVVLAQNGIPHVPTFLVARVEDLARVSDVLQFPVVLKPIVGAKGHQVIRVDDENSLRNVAPFYLKEHRALYAQQCVRTPGAEKRDLRVRVINHRAIYAFYRYAPPGGFLTNLSTGGSWNECPLTPEISELSERCSRAFKAPVVGVDIIEDERGDYRVLEVNTTPAITWPHEATVPYVADLVEQFMSGAKG